MEIILRGTIEEITEACRKLGRRAKTRETDEQPEEGRGFITQGGRTFLADGGIKAQSLPRKLKGFAEACEVYEAGGWVSIQTPDNHICWKSTNGKMFLDGYGACEFTFEDRFGNSSERNYDWFEVAKQIKSTPTLPRKLSGFEEALDLMKRGFWVDWTSGDAPTGNWAYTWTPDKGENEDCVRVWERGEVLDTVKTPDQYFMETTNVNWFEVADPTAGHAHP